jgi:hypothetical protein
LAIIQSPNDPLQTPKNQLQIIPSYTAKQGTSSASSTYSKSSNCSSNNQLKHTQSQSKPNRNNYVHQNGDRPRRACTLFVCNADNPSELSFEANVILTDGKLLFNTLNKLYTIY